MNSPENNQIRPVENVVEKKEVDQAYEVVQYLLKSRYDIDKIDHLEEYSIKFIIKNCIIEARDYEISKKNNEVDGSGRFVIEAEASRRWILERFGLTEKDLQNVYIITDPITGKYEEFEDYRKNEAEQLYQKIMGELEKVKDTVSKNDYYKLQKSIKKYDISKKLIRQLRQYRSESNLDL